MLVFLPFQVHILADVTSRLFPLPARDWTDNRTSHQYRNHVCEKCHKYIFLARVYRLCDAPYTYYKTDQDNQGYRKKAYIIHFRFASVFPSIYGLSLIFIFSLWLFFTLCIAVVWSVRIVRMFRLHTALFCAILQASFISMHARGKPLARNFFCRTGCSLLRH